MDRLRFSPGVGSRVLVRLIVAALVPAVLLASSDAAIAANMNTWQKIRVHFGDAFTPVAGQAVDCSFSARYTADGEGVQWNDGGCLTSHDMTPGESQPGEPGGPYSLTFKGKRAGEVAVQPYQQTQTQASRAIDVRWSTAVGATAGSHSATIHLVNYSASETFQAYARIQCYDPATATFTGGQESTSSTAPIAPGYTWNQLSVSCPAPKVVGVIWAGSFPLTPTIASADRPALVNKYVFQTAASPQAGTGLGNPCETTHQGVLGEGASTWRGMRAVIPSGQKVFPEQVGGFCIVEQVCLDVSDQSAPWWVNKFDAQCSELNLGPPRVPATPEEDVEATAPEANGDDVKTPDAPTTEQGFWGAILDLLQSLFTGLVQALAKVFGAVGGVAGAILEGLVGVISGLFIPSPGFIAGEVDSMKNAWADTAPGQMLETVTVLPGKLTAPTSVGCEGPGLTIQGGSVPTFGQTTADATAGQTTLHPFSSCSEAMGNLASIVRIGLSLLVGVGAALTGLRILGGAFGIDATLPGGSA